MRGRELALLEAHHWHGPAPDRFPPGAADDDRRRARSTDVWMLVAIFVPAADRARLPRRRRDGPVADDQAQGHGARRRGQPVGQGAAVARRANPSDGSTRCCSPSTSARPCRRRSPASSPDRLFGGWGVAIGVVLNVIVFFVLAEAVPKTYAVIHPERAAQLTARPVSALVTFPLLRLDLAGPDRAHQRDRAGQGPQEGPVRQRAGAARHRRGRGRGRGDRARGARADREHHRVRRHGRPRGDGAPPRHGDHRATTRPSPAPSTWRSRTGTAACRCSGHGDDDDVVGLAYTKDLIRAEREGGGDLPVLDLVRPVRFIPENKPVSRLMREMQAEQVPPRDRRRRVRRRSPA